MAPLNFGKKFGKNVKKIAEELFDPKRKAAWSMTSWFAIPEENMLDLELLCRASAFLVKAKNPNFGRKYHIVTVSHCIAPWRFPKYYPEPWVQAVNEQHTHYTIEMRGNDGKFICQVDCIPRSYHHKTKDLAVLHIQEEDHYINKVFNHLNIKADELLPASITITPTNVSIMIYHHLKIVLIILPHCNSRY